MRVILIDDEPLALDHMEKLLTDIGGVNIVGKYINPQQGIEEIEEQKPEVVFLDIEMPGISGIDLAEKIQSCGHDIHIVFVTAYSEYAVKAFEVNAVDYVMKPVQKKRINETIKRLKMLNENSGNKEMIQHPGMICCFQTLQFIRCSEELENLKVHWRTSKAKDLFSFLVHHRMKPVRKDLLIELFWPDSEYEKGVAQLYGAIYQIRKTLSSVNFDIKITSQDHSYMLDLNDVQIDVDEFEKGLKTLLEGKNPTFSSIQNLLWLYQGAYLSEEGYLWAESERERLRVLWTHYIKEIGELLIGKEEYSKALILYQRMQTIDPYLEESYFMLMKLYDILGERGSVELQYNRLHQMLWDEYGLEVEKDISEWYQHWKQRSIKFVE